MKNSKQYSKKIQALYRKLKRKYPKITKVVYDEPTEAVVYGIISEEMTGSASQSVIKRFTDHFVDTNDLRVSLTQEKIELLGDDSSLTKDIALTLNVVLRAIFDKYHTVSLDELKKTGKRPARQSLEKINGLSHFVVCYCMLTALDAHAIPLTETMVNYLKENALVASQADEDDIEGFLTRLIPANSGYEFYALLKMESEAGAKIKRVTEKEVSGSTKKTKKKTAKKTASKTKKKTAGKSKKKTKK